MQPFYRADHKTIDALLQAEERNALLIHIGFYGIHQSDPYYGFPYIPFAKCESVAGAVRDNGRILKAAYLETWITDIDLKIILEQYSYEDYQIIDCWQSQYGALPAPLILTVQEYYRKKTALKGGDQEQEYYYMKSKNKLNSCYGMMAQDPGKETVQYIQGAEDPYQVKLQELSEILQKYTKNAFLVYQWGVWVTAWARLRLYDGIRLAYEQGALPVYCDTDSVKYTGMVDWSAYNRQRQQDSIDSGSLAVVLVDGEEGFVKIVTYGDTWIELRSINPLVKPRRFNGPDVQKVRVVGIVTKIIKSVTGKEELIFPPSPATPAQKELLDLIAGLNADQIAELQNYVDFLKSKMK
jgi:hypothetical protein